MKIKDIEKFISRELDQPFYQFERVTILIYIILSYLIVRRLRIIVTATSKESYWII